ncbi:hypothetical protein MPTK1_5g12940 [Marchantia polymorpha subsp. ruderalis]|nr:hypothetical protein MARPO_0092s0014 [Marchantia polymorpha]PTQ33041.1 hypothetical protein MARPO_0092s0014 [Marchantia polymorpha]BBN11560.1 hypothetical protein Mp_5g12940 [Marchantia polymorpha subsp. ruderalis]BBN11561.1 hypothetical protein Mp_5g12940 [Marchantia polymorpha subsp. ruderalis]|eukprot:PTQ33040.1 hypothetical protein MARPO_0092s0014 [Marchantia polymorpha]
MEEVGGSAATTSMLELPEDVVENILGRLTLPALTQVGIVCKQWQRISSSIVECRQSASYCLVAFPVGMTPGTRETNYWPTGQIRLAMFDPFARSWLKVKHPFPPIGAYPFQPQRRRIDWDLFLVPSTGGYSGLVCFVIPSHAPSTVFHYWIGNPITGKWENIPGPRKQSSYREIAHQLVVCPLSKSFKIFNFAIQESGVHEWNCCVQIYDSTGKKWRSARQLLSIPKFSSIRVGTASATVVYLMLFMNYNQVCVPLAAGQTQCFTYYRVFRIVGFDIQDEQWLSVTPESSFEFIGDYCQHATWDYCPQLIIKPGTEHLSSSSSSCLQLVAGTYEPCSFEPCHEHCQECAGQQLAGKICIAEYEQESTTWKIKKELESEVYLADCSENLIINSCSEARAGFIYCAHMRGSWKSPCFYSPERTKHHLSDDSWTHLPPPGFGVPENNLLRRFTLCRFSPRVDV